MAGAIQKAYVVSEKIGSDNIKKFEEASGQSFVVGQLVKLSSGYVAVVAGNTGAERILGIAMTAATGSQGGDILVHLLPPGTTFAMSAYHVTPASAVTAQANVGSKAQITVSSGKTVIDVANLTGTDNKCPVIIEGIDTKYAVGAEYGLYLCSVRNGYYDLQTN